MYLNRCGLPERTLHKRGRENKNVSFHRPSLSWGVIMWWWCMGLEDAYGSRSLRQRGCKGGRQASHHEPCLSAGSIRLIGPAQFLKRRPAPARATHGDLACGRGSGPRGAQTPPNTGKGARDAPSTRVATPRAQRLGLRRVKAGATPGARTVVDAMPTGHRTKAHRRVPIQRLPARNQP